MAQQLSARTLLYHKISENLIDRDVKSLRSLLVDKLGRGRVEKATPQDIFLMLEDAAMLPRGKLGLLIQLLTSLGQNTLAKEAKKVEEEEKSTDDHESEKNKDLVDRVANLAVRDPDPDTDPKRHAKADSASVPRVTEQQLNELAGNLGSEWENLTIHLGMKKADVDRFKANNPNNMRFQVFAMLVAWKAKAGASATVETLVCELRKFGIDQDKYEFLLDKN